MFIRLSESEVMRINLDNDIIFYRKIEDMQCLLVGFF